MSQQVNQRPTIAIDIDDVLADNAKGFVEFSNQRWGTSLEVGDYNEHWAKIWQVDNAETDRRANAFNEAHVVLTYNHDPSAIKALNKLKDNFNLIIVTARRLQTKGDTLVWVKEHYPGIFEDDQIHFAGIWDDIDDGSVSRTKADLMKDLGVDYLIDDQLKHCIGAASFGVQAILFGNYSWNQADYMPENIRRVEDWAGVLRYFDGIV